MRYFFEVSYKGTRYAGFQVQQNANTIQSEVEAVLKIFFKRPIALTGSSRTDAGVHALQNFFHGDSEDVIKPAVLYNLNAMLPPDIVLKNIFPVKEDAHCRFDAIAREYHYFIYYSKDPFKIDNSFFYPYSIDEEALTKSAREVLINTNFEAFSKKNAQVKTHVCNIYKSEWVQKSNGLVYQIKANRFLRGMVRSLVATMLRVGRGKMSVEDFASIFTFSGNERVDFASPPHALYLNSVTYPTSIFRPELQML